MAVDRTNQKSYQLARQAITLVPFAVVPWSKAVILGRQPVYTEPGSGDITGRDIGNTPVVFDLDFVLA